MDHPDNFQLHNDIKNGNLPKVKSYIEKFRLEKLAYVDGKSAIAVASSSGSYKVYEYLMLNGFTLGPHEKQQDSSTGEPSFKKFKLLETNLKYAMNVNIEHLEILKSKSLLSHN